MTMYASDGFKLDIQLINVSVQVFHQVQNLFKDAPDLLLEFKNFLPFDGSGHPFAVEAMQEHTWNDAIERRNITPHRKQKAAGSQTGGAVRAKIPIRNQRVSGGRVSAYLL